MGPDVLNSAVGGDGIAPIPIAPERRGDALTLEFGARLRAEKLSIRVLSVTPPEFGKGEKARVRVRFDEVRPGPGGTVEKTGRRGSLVVGRSRFTEFERYQTLGSYVRVPVSGVKWG